MNNHDKNTGNEKHTGSSVSSIRNDASSNDAASGKSSSGREPQHGSSIDNRSNQRDATGGKTGSTGNSNR